MSQDLKLYKKYVRLSSRYFVFYRKRLVFSEVILACIIWGPNLQWLSHNLCVRHVTSYSKKSEIMDFKRFRMTLILLPSFVNICQTFPILKWATHTFTLNQRHESTKRQRGDKESLILSFLRSPVTSPVWPRWFQEV